MNRRQLLAGFVGGVLAPGLVSGNETLWAGTPTGRKGMEGRHDFDFLMGRDWAVENRVLEERLAGSDRWETFEGTLSGVEPILGGLGQVDRYEATRGGQLFHATSLRVYDPVAGLWRIYWGDTFSYRIVPQVEGRFTGNRGEFFGEEMFGDGLVPLRFVWKDTDQTVPMWEQAYRDERTGEWETNWTMRFVPQ